MSKNIFRYSPVKNFPDDLPDQQRRTFMKQVFGAAAAAAALPLVNCSQDSPSPEPEELAVSVGKLAADDPGDERFWEQVKDQFMVRNDLVMINAANLCPSPYTVQKTVFDYTSDIDRDASPTNRRKFNNLKQEARKALAGFLGASEDEIAITRNTSESNNTVISGLTLNRGDEVVIWDQNHPTNNVAWDVRAERHGFKVVRVSTPTLPDSRDAILKTFTDALTPRTKVLAFSHVSNVSGTEVDAKKLCAIARENGILTLVDGAQTFGALNIDLHDMGCDFYTGSSHKWFCGPREVGVLYVRRQLCDMLWPLHVGVGWGGAVKSGAKKFETLGQQDDSRHAAMTKAVEFHTAIGTDRIEARVRTLASVAKDELKKKIPGISFNTPHDKALSGGVVVFKAEGIDLGKALNTLYTQHNIGCAVMGGNLAGVRFSPHIYNTLADVEKAVASAAQLV